MSRVSQDLPVIIDAMRAEDWEAVRAIYEEGIASGAATFETSPPDWETWDQNHLACCRLAARQHGNVAGWAALSPVSRRSAYAGVAEVSIYVAGSARGRGVGKALLAALIAESERAGLWMLQAAVMAGNKASLALFFSAGFREVGRRERIAQLHGVWRDTILLERRSRVVGI